MKLSICLRRRKHGRPRLRNDLPADQAAQFDWFTFVGPWPTLGSDSLKQIQANDSK
jgi:hypothetical protein